MIIDNEALIIQIYLVDITTQILSNNSVTLYMICAIVSEYITLCSLAQPQNIVGLVRFQ